MISLPAAITIICITVAGIVFGVVVGYNLGTREVQTKAVQTGHATFRISKSTGKIKFYWRRLKR